MTKHHLPNGLTYYHCQAFELLFIGGLGICDDCGFIPTHGYLVPVLDHYQCPECFADWSARCKHYPEDDWFEQINIRYWESRLPLGFEAYDYTLDDFPIPSVNPLDLTDD